MTLNRQIRTAAATGALVTLLLATPGASFAQQASPLDQITQEEIQKFCTAIAEPARDQRYLMQKQELEKLQADIDSRIETLQTRRAEYEDWLKRRNDFMQKADGQLLEIYKKMAPDAAAPQLQKANVILAAAIIMKLPPRQSSLILSEMDPDKAALVASIMSSASDPNTSKDPS